MDLLIAVIIVLFCTFIGVSLERYKDKKLAKKFDSANEQSEHVEVVKKELDLGESDINELFGLVTFKFPDGTEKEFDIIRALPTLRTVEAVWVPINVGDKGIVTYKEIEGARNFYKRDFISFEKDS